METDKFIDTWSHLCVSMHKLKAGLNAYSLVCGYSDACTLPSKLIPPGVQTKKLKECTQITACRQEEKSKRAGGGEGVIKQESTSVEIGSVLF